MTRSWWIAGCAFRTAAMGPSCFAPTSRCSVEVPASALVLTHGHEDHVGAIPFLLQRFPMPVFGPAYALELLKRRFARDYPNLPLDVEQVTPGQRFSAGPFELEPISVTHSIAGATALAIHTAQGTIVHSGDFKIDQNLHGEHFDRARLLQLGEAGVRLLLSDSTNALSPGRTGSERMVARALDASVADAPNRVVVCFVFLQYPSPTRQPKRCQETWPLRLCHWKLGSKTPRHRSRLGPDRRPHRTHRRPVPQRPNYRALRCCTSQQAARANATPDSHV